MKLYLILPSKIGPSVQTQIFRPRHLSDLGTWKMEMTPPPAPSFATKVYHVYNYFLQFTHRHTHILYQNLINRTMNIPWIVFAVVIQEFLEVEITYLNSKSIIFHPLKC